MILRALVLGCLCLLGLGNVPTPSLLWSQEMDASATSATCRCGCPCQPGCQCGCEKGAPCTCKVAKKGSCSPSQPYAEAAPIASPAYSAEEPYAWDGAGEYDSLDTDVDEESNLHACYPCYEPAEYCPWPGGRSVIDTTECYDPYIPCQGFQRYAFCPDPCKFYTTGEWFPEKPPLFRPFMADPRQITASVGWRFNDDALTKNIIPVSYFDTVPLYRWCDIWPWHGKLQIDIEGALWACFDPCTDSAPLMNADYYIGLPISYAIDCWSFRFRVYHISSHLGDEFLLNHPGYDRRNPSAEYTDLFASYEITPDIRLYGGLGYVIQYDESFRFNRFYVEWGTELRLQGLGYRDSYNCLYALPIFGMHFRWRHDFKHHIDSTYVLGWEWGNLTGMRRRYRIFLEYHDGFSSEGQFCRKFTNYLSIRFTHGF